MDWIGLDWGGLKIRRVLDLWWGLEGERGYRTPLCPSIGLSAQNHLLHLVMAPTGKSISSYTPLSVKICFLLFKIFKKFKRAG